MAGTTGSFTYATITFNGTKEDWLLGEKGYRKFALHEIGHLHGLAHTPVNAPPRSSVMNGPAYFKGKEGPDDPANNMPMTVQYCDYVNAKKYMQPSSQ